MLHEAIIEMFAQLLIAAMRVAARWPAPHRHDAYRALMDLPKDFFVTEEWGN